MANEPVITLSFTAQRLDYIANTLAQRPWAEVHAILADIQQQIAQQQGPATAGAVIGNGRDPAPMQRAQ